MWGAKILELHTVVCTDSHPVFWMLLLKYGGPGLVAVHIFGQFLGFLSVVSRALSLNIDGFTVDPGLVLIIPMYINQYSINVFIHSR